MKTLIKAIAFTAVAAVLLTGCAKPPTQERADAQAAIDNCVKLEADKYGQQELAGLKSGLAAADSEIKVQEDKFFKNFDKAKEMIGKVKADATALAQVLPQRKEAAKQAAMAAQTEATAALTAAKDLLTKAPKGKDTRADIEAYKADLASVEAEMASVQSMIAAEDFLGAKDKAVALKDKAAGVGAQLQAAIDKAGAKKAPAKAKKK